MKKTLSLFAVLLLAAMLLAAPAGAHVVVYPREVTQGTYEKFTVRVPSEIDGTFTTGVEVHIPEDVNITRVEPKPGWEYRLERDESGKIVSIEWTALEEGLSITEFAEFNMQGRVGDEAAELVWKAYQKYADGTEVAWVGAEGSDEPASVTAVHPRKEADEKPAAAAVPAWLTALAVISLLLSLAALIAALSRKKS